MSASRGLTRRNFLRLAGALGAGSLVSWRAADYLAASGQIANSYPLPDLTFRHARILHSTAGQAAGIGRNALRPAWSNALIAVHQWSGDQAVLDTGLMHARALQPVRLKTPLPVSSLPALIEVCAGSAPIHPWCDASGPAVAVIGHHGILRADQRQTVRGREWLGVRSGEAFLGWTQASFWSQVSDFTDSARRTVQISIDRSRLSLTAFGSGEPLFSVPVSIHSALPDGIHSVSQRLMEASYPVDGLFGVPYVVEAGSFTLGGAYWHNDFGGAAEAVGPAIQMLPEAAAWLYRHLSDRDSIRIL
ncbi:L,D-transpeptidase [Geitlerinema splendidum]|jgi:hypothetical protein|nr:L,D-transpeptidase [Geitlerinema splendidum]